MKVLLSIKPEFANRIFDGTKKYEFRRLVFKRKEITKVVVYASAPVSKVIGEFEIGRILHKDLRTLWEETESFSGISQDYFYQYFQNKEEGYAIEIKQTKKYPKPLNLRQNYGVAPPQSFLYLN